MGSVLRMIFKFFYRYEKRICFRVRHRISLKLCIRETFACFWSDSKYFLNDFSQSNKQFSFSDFQSFQIRNGAFTPDASNSVKVCFLTPILTWEDLALHFKPTISICWTHIFQFVVFSNSPDAFEKVDLMLFWWSARLMKIYSLTSFIKTYHFWHFSTFHTLQEQPSELHNLQHFLHHHQNCTSLFDQYWFK